MSEQKAIEEDAKNNIINRFAKSETGEFMLQKLPIDEKEAIQKETNQNIINKFWEKKIFGLERLIFYKKIKYINKNIWRISE